LISSEEKIGYVRSLDMDVWISRGFKSRWTVAREYEQELTRDRSGAIQPRVIDIDDAIRSIDIDVRRTVVHGHIDIFKPRRGSIRLIPEFSPL